MIWSLLGPLTMKDGCTVPFVIVSPRVLSLDPIPLLWSSQLRVSGRFGEDMSGEGEWQKEGKRKRGSERVSERVVRK